MWHLPVWAHDRPLARIRTRLPASVRVVALPGVLFGNMIQGRMEAWLEMLEV